MRVPEVQKKAVSNTLRLDCQRCQNSKGSLRHFPNCAISFDSSRDTNTLFSVTTNLNYFMKVPSRQNFGCRINLAAASKTFVLCIGILLLQECQTSAIDFDFF